MNSINKTLYIPLYGKSYVSKKGVILQDTKAEYIWEKEKIPLEGKSRSKWLAYFMAMRSKVFDEWVKAQIKNTYETVVIHIGCGMDSRVERVNADCLWYDVDFPNVISTREKYYNQTDTYKMIPTDAKNTNWITALQGKNAIVIFEGISMYIGFSDMQNILKKLTSQFDSVKILMDCYTEKAVGMSKYKNPVKEVGVNSSKLYGCDDPKTFEKATKLMFKQEHNMTPVCLIAQLQGIEKFIFKKLYAGKLAKSLYKIYEYESKKETTD